MTDDSLAYHKKNLKTKGLRPNQALKLTVESWVKNSWR
jgi:hypothetical protein